MGLSVMGSLSILRAPMRRLLVLSATACLLALPAEAQQRGQRPANMPTGTISGAVTDADTDAPIPVASVAVWRVPRRADRDTSLVTGTVTDEAGAFRIEGVPPGRFFVDVSFVGYVTERVEDLRIDPRAADRTVDLGTVALVPDVEQLGRVEVQAEREQVAIQIDRTVYNTADDPVASGGSATTVLETIPSVDVDVDGNVSLRGSGNVAVLINGRPAPVGADFVASYLKSLPAGSVERVEVIPNPSARFDPEGMGGIINLVLKQDVDRGVGGSVSSGVDTQGGYNATGVLTYGSGPWNLSGSYGLRRDARGGGGTSFRENRTIPDAVPFLDQAEDEDRFGLSHLINVSAEYALSAKTVVTSSAQLGLRSDNEDEFNTFIELDADRNETLQYERFVEERGDGWNTDLRLGLRHDFRGRGARGETQHNVSAEARYNASANQDDETYTEFVATPDAPRELRLAATDRDRSEASLQIDYVRPLGDLRLEAGYSGEIETIASDLFSELAIDGGALSPDTSVNNTFDYDRTIHAGYAQAAGEWGGLGIQVGLRVETATRTFSLLDAGDVNTDSTFETTYASVFPSAFLSYELSASNVLKASYSRRINRPRTRFLNPFPSFDNPTSIRLGNPALDPEYVDAFELGYVPVRPVGIGHRHAVLTAARPTSSPGFRSFGDDGVSVRTVDNLDTSESYGVELIGSFAGRGVTEGLRGFASLEGYQVASSGSTDEGDLENDTFGWGGRLNASYAIGDRLGIGGLDLQANVRYRAPRDTEQGRIGSFTFVNFAVRKALLGDRASLTLQLRDPFDLAGFSFELDQPALYQEIERQWGAQSVGVTFQYNFGQQQEQRSRRGRPDGEGGGFDGEEF